MKGEKKKGNRNIGQREKSVRGNAMPETVPVAGCQLKSLQKKKKKRVQSPRNLPDKKNCASWCLSSRTCACCACSTTLTQEVSAWNTSLERRPKASNNFGKLSFGKHASPKAFVYLRECLKSFMVLSLSTFNCIYHTQDHQPSKAVTHVVHYCMVNLPNYSWVIFSSRSTNYQHKSQNIYQSTNSAQQT